MIRVIPPVFNPLLIVGTEVNWVLDADRSGFFDTINCDWLRQLVEHRIAGRRILRWLGRVIQGHPQSYGVPMKGPINNGHSYSDIVSTIKIRER